MTSPDSSENPPWETHQYVFYNEHQTQFPEEYSSDCLDEEHALVFLEKEEFLVIELVLVAVLGVNLVFLTGTALAMCIKLLRKRRSK